MIPRSEIRTKRYLESKGYYYVRSGRSFGLFDFVAMNEEEILLIQAKCGQGPRKAEQKRLVDFVKYPVFAKKQIWIWRRYERDPIIKEVQRGVTV